MVFMYRADTGLYGRSGGGAGGSGDIGPVGCPAVAGSIMIVLPTGTEKEEAPSDTESMVTPKTGFGGSWGGSLSGTALGGGVTGGGVTTARRFGITFRGGSGMGRLGAGGVSGGT